MIALRLNVEDKNHHPAWEALKCHWESAHSEELPDCIGVVRIGSDHTGLGRAPPVPPPVVKTADTVAVELVVYFVKPPHSVRFPPGHASVSSPVQQSSFLAQKDQPATELAMN